MYRGPQLAVWGSDYRFTDALANFGNMEKVLGYVNAHPDKFGLRCRFTTLAL